MEMEEGDGQDDDQLAELSEHMDDDSSSASSVSSTGTIIPTPSQKLFARPQGYVSNSSSRGTLLPDLYYGLR